MAQNIADIASLYEAHPEIDSIAGALKKKGVNHILVQDSCGSQRAIILSTLRSKLKKQLTVVLENQEEASYLQHDIAAIAGSEDCALLFPTTHRVRQKGQDESYTIQRTEVLARLKNSSRNPKDSMLPPVIITYPDALTEPVASQEELMTHSLTLQKGQQMQESELQKRLAELGFQRADFVYEPGQYAIRGGIVDIYSYAFELPFRLDFFGDEIDSIRTFDIETQLSKQIVEQAEIIGSSQSKKNDSGATLIDYLPGDTVFVAQDFNYVLKTLEGLAFGKIADEISGKSTIELSQHSYFKAFAKVSMNTKPQPVFRKNFDLLYDEIVARREEGYRIYILSDSRKQTDRLGAILDTYKEQSGTFLHDDILLQDKTDRQLRAEADKEDHIFLAVFPTLHDGFIDHRLKACFFTDHQIFERYHKVEQRTDTARKGKVLLTLKELNQLQVGDYVVHVDHGIGRFGGLVKTSVNGKPQEMIKLQYKGGEIFVSIHSLHRISKYKGKEGGEPTISKLGSGQWERLKERTKEKVKDIARDLIKLYAARKAEKGFAYSADSFMQHELEASFIYEDTPDQAKATLDLKHDMESPMPMDRLICGDVGFGKTELAMRAAFKAATDNKQTAVLVPTTVLALQHYNSFSERFRNFPVRVEYLSRAKTPKQTKEILNDLESGKIDILIGTHKLVGKSVKWHDLGLLIIDEEQKFGVAVKEKLKSLKVNVDTLTLTATPIPRTLQFSLLGARDLSVMTTPPANRYPIQTEVITPTDEDILQEAIRLELSRNGQVFFIHNRVSTLDMVAHQLERLCPEARIVTANGQMPPEQVEKILTDFINYDYDILVATSIIENGVDIPNVNTIIISGAQHFGLSDLHQMRGRVGRSNKKAYCYLIAPSSELLTNEARRRLNALETFADLGSGFHLAMQDLDIRGAGNMLGAEQSGFIADLGYETYQKILNEAVMELKEDEFQELFTDAVNGDQSASHHYVQDSQLESDLEIGFPSTYVENISERISLYRELDGIQNEEALLAFKKRMIDRFGTLPEAGEELLQVVRLRWLCMRLGIEKIVLKQERLSIYFPSNLQSPYYQSETFGKVIGWLMSRWQRCRVRDIDGRRSAVIENVKTVNGAFTLLSKIEKGE